MAGLQGGKQLGWSKRINFAFKIQLWFISIFSLNIANMGTGIGNTYIIIHHVLKLNVNVSIQTKMCIAQNW